MVETVIILGLLRGLYNRIYPGVSTRVTIPFLIIMLIVAGIGTFIVMRLVAGTIDERVNNQLLDSAQTVTGVITEFERDRLATLRALTFTEGVATAISEGDTESLERLLSGLAANNDIDELIVFDADGQSVFRLVLAGRDEPTLLDLNDWEIVTNVINGVEDDLGDKFTDIRTVDEREMVYFTAAVFDETNDIAGGIAIGTEMLNFIRFLSEQSFTTLILIDDQGQVIDSTIRTLVTTDTERVQFIEDPTSIIQEIDNGTTPLVERPVDNTEYRLLYTSFDLRGTLFGLIAVGIQTDFIADRIGTSRNTFTGLFMAVFVVVMISGILISRSIVHPLARIVDTTRAIRSGDLSRRVQLGLPDELGELSASFDHMTDQLVARNQEINGLYLAQLEETARREAVLTSISDIVIVQDTHGRVILHNKAAEEIFQALPANPDAQRTFHKTLREPEELAVPQSLSVLDRHFSALATPVLMKSGETLGHVIVFRDITEIVETQKLKDKLILQMSHELRTPYAAAYGYAELQQLMMQQDNIEQAKAFGSNVTTHLNTLGTMLNRVVEVSVILARQVDVNLTVFNLMDLIYETLENHDDQLKAASAELVLMAARQNLMVKADYTLLQTAFEAVVENSYKYTIEGGKIMVRVNERDGCVTIEVKDTGVGIGPDEHEKVFEHMYRGRSADAGPTDTRGLGLGLYISKQYVEAHQGRIDLTSQEGVGTTVKLSLPIGFNET